MKKHETDKDAVEKGHQTSKKAKLAFESGDFEEAFHLYIEAEEHYRHGYEWPGDRVFFMEASALRCLEELLDNGRLDLYDRYQTKAKSFLAEWGQSKIAAVLGRGYRGQHGHRIEEAQTFFLWRRSRFQGSSAFLAASTEIKNREYAKATDILDKLIGGLEGSSDPESEALRAIARSKREMLVVQEQLGKRHDQRDISIIGDAYLRAAEVSQLPETSVSSQRARIEAFRDWFMSNGLKFKAFSCLRDARMADPIPSLAEAKHLFARAVEHAERAISAPGGSDFPRSHHAYLRFWQSIVSERLHLLAFAGTGKGEDFKLCTQAWREALEIARDFQKKGLEERIFPNRFYSVRDLELEGTFLNAAYAFWQRDWLRCAAYLEEWRREFPSEYRWSWREIQGYIRLLLAKALGAFTEGNHAELRDICKELERLERSEPIGNVGRVLVTEVQGLQAKIGIPMSEDYFNFLLKYFPLDSHSDSYETESEIEALLSLPQRIYNWLEQTRLPSTSTEVEEFKAKLLGCVEALAGYSCDYHLQVFSPGEPPPLPELEASVERLSSLGAVRWKIGRAHV